MKMIHISFGGSHRKNKRCQDIINNHFGPTMSMPVSMGSKRRQIRVEDTPENREFAKKNGFGCKKGWDV